MLISSGAGSSGTDSFTSDACAGMQSSGSSGGSGRSKLAGFALHLGSTVADACMLWGRCNMRVRKIEEVGVGRTRCVGCVLWLHRPCIGLRLRKHADDFLQECGIVLVLRVTAGHAATCDAISVTGLT